MHKNTGTFLIKKLLVYFMGICVYIYVHEYTHMNEHYMHVVSKEARRGHLTGAAALGIYESSDMGAGNLSVYIRQAPTRDSV